MNKKLLSREEEIKQVASFYQLSNSQEKFIEGAKWADEHPRKGLWDAEKVIKFIHTIFTETISGNVISRTNTTVDEVIKDLRKAMEE